MPCADFYKNVRNHLNVTYPNRWIGREGTTSGTIIVTKSDNSRLFLWGGMKTMEYETPVTSEEDLIARVHGAIESLTRQLNLLGYV